MRKNIKKIKLFFYKNQRWILSLSLFFVFVLAIFLRLIFINDSIAWMDDVRDLLVVKHIVDYGENLFVAPFASQGNDSFQNTPVYFWILSAFYAISRSLFFGSFLLFFVLGILTIFFNYLLAKELTNKKVALIFAFFTAISVVFIESSRAVLQPHLNVFINSVFIYLLFISYKRKKIFFLFLSLFLAFLMISIHLSFFVVFPSIILTQILILKKITSNNKEFVKNFLYYLLFLLIFSFLYVFLSGNDASIIFDFINDLFKKSFDGNFSDGFLQIPTFSFFEHLFKLDNVFVYLFLLSLIFLYVRFVSKGKSKILKQDNYFFYILVIFLLPLIPLLFVDFYTPFFYFFPFYSLLLFFISSILVEIFYRNKFISILIFVLITFSLSRNTFFFYKDKRNFLAENAPANFYSSAREISTLIDKDIKENNYSFFLVNTARIEYESYEKTFMVFDWDVLSFYYFLEDFHQKKYLKLVDSRINLAENNSFNNFWVDYRHGATPESLYLVCIVRDPYLFRRTNLDYLDQHYCLEPYLEFINGCYNPSRVEYELLFSGLDSDPLSPYILYKIRMNKDWMNFSCVNYLDYVTNNNDLFPRVFP